MSDNAIATVRTTGLALNEGQTVLGERQVNIPTAGSIRPGIMVPTPTAARNPKAVEAYEAGVAAGKPWKVIAKDMLRAMNAAENAKSPLMPKNAPYFTVRPSDFISPETAHTIIARYGEDRGEGKRVYRLPVVFPIDSWQAVMPHALKCYRANELVYWSEYHNGVRMCMTRAKPEYDERAKRFKRPFGGLRIVFRAENEGRCEPENCPEYQAGKCKLSGHMLFYPFGVSGGAIKMPTTSFYALNGMRGQLEMMLAVKGRIAGLFDGRPLFYLAKRREEVSMFDTEKGERARTQQWITVLETVADMSLLLTAPEEEDHDDLVSEAVAVLEGSRTPREAHDDIEDAEVVGGDVVPEAGPGDEETPSDLEIHQAEFRRLWREFQFPWSEAAADVQANFGSDGVHVLDDTAALARLNSLLVQYDPQSANDRRELWQRLRQPALPSDIGDDDVPF